MISEKYPREGFGADRFDPCIGLRHGVNQGPEWYLETTEVPLLVPFVVGGVTVDHRNVAGEAIVLDRWGPRRRGVKSRLGNPATTPFLCPSDAVLGNTVSLRHPRS